jgi:hypothetical protein
MLGKRQKQTPKIKVEPTGKCEHKVQVTRGRKVLVDRIVCLDREELDAFLLGCRLIEDILERSKQR